jgi:PAS domain S-box-containing protein/putative nucleotidyltransferase with HDIG domain
MLPKKPPRRSKTTRPRVGHPPPAQPKKKDGRIAPDFYKQLFGDMLEGYVCFQAILEAGVPVDFVYVEVNAAFENLTGLKNVTGKKASLVIPGLKESNPELFDIYSRAALTGKPERLETYIDALHAWFSIGVYGMGNEFFVAIFQNITEHKQAQQAAEIGERRFRALIENSAEAISLLDANASVIYDSPAAPRMLGYGPTEWIGKNVFELVHPSEQYAVQEMFQRLAATPGARTGLTLRLRHQNGSWVWIEAVGTNLLNEPGVMAIVVNYRDVTERKLTEEQIQRHTQNLTSLHEIQQAIASSFDMRTSLDILLEKVTAQLDVDAASVLLLDPYTNTLEYAAQRGFRRSAVVQNASIPLGRSFAGRAALGRKMVQAHGDNLTQDDPHFATLWREESFESYFGVPLIAKGHVKGVLEVFHRARLAGNPGWVDFLEMLGSQAAIAIDNAQLFENLQHANMELSLAYDATIEGWSYALDLRDKETEGHSLRVTKMTLRLAEAIGINKSEIVHIRRGALLHDIGKMGVPDHILLKPDALTPEEWELMKQHPVFAYNMLSRIAYLRPAIAIPYCHHEKWDGSGYPRGLRGEEIPLAARLFAIVDVWDALRSDRTYRPGWPRERVLAHIQEQSGKHFDPQVVRQFLEMLQKHELPLGGS